MHARQSAPQNTLTRSAPLHTRPAPSTPPKQGKARAEAFAAWIFVALFLLYSVYNVYQEMQQLPPTYYQVLGVPNDASMYACTPRRAAHSRALTQVVPRPSS